MKSKMLFFKLWLINENWLFSKISTEGAINYFEIYNSLYAAIGMVKP